MKKQNSMGEPASSPSPVWSKLEDFIHHHIEVVLQRVLECLDWPEAGELYPFQTVLDDGRFLLVGGADDARWGGWIYSVATQPSPAPVRIPGEAPVAALHGERLLVFDDDDVDRAVLYGLAGGALTELGRVDAPRGSPWGDDVIVGGMLAVGGRYAAPRGLVDLEGDAPEVYAVVAEQGCGWGRRIQRVRPALGARGVRGSVASRRRVRAAGRGLHVLRGGALPGRRARA